MTRDHPLLERFICGLRGHDWEVVYSRRLVTDRIEIAKECETCGAVTKEYRNS